MSQRPVRLFRAWLPALALLGLSACAAGTPAPAQQPLLDRSDTIKTATLRMNDPDPAAVRNKVYANVGQFGAEVTAEHWTDDHGVKYQGTMTLRLPSANFLPMVDWLRQTFAVKSMDLSARVAGPGDTKTGAVTGEVAYSTIFMSFDMESGYADALALGLSYGGDALKASLQTVVPVVAFLVPYALALWMVIWLIRLARWIGRKVGGRVNSAPSHGPPGAVASASGAPAPTASGAGDAGTEKGVAAPSG